MIYKVGNRTYTCTHNPHYKMDLYLCHLGTRVETASTSPAPNISSCDSHIHLSRNVLPYLLSCRPETKGSWVNNGLEFPTAKRRHEHLFFRWKREIKLNKCTLIHELHTPSFYLLNPYLPSISLSYSIRTWFDTNNKLHQANFRVGDWINLKFL